MTEKTSIKIRESTRDRLASLGSFGESYDDVISKILEKMEEDNKEETK